MEVIIKSNPPFIIRTYEQHFTISENFKALNEKIYYYNQILKIETKSGKLNWFLAIASFIFTRNRIEKDYDELIILYKNGKSEIRYIETGLLYKIEDILQFIQRKLK